MTDHIKDKNYTLINWFNHVITRVLQIFSSKRFRLNLVNFLKDNASHYVLNATELFQCPEPVT
jgi:hypothetical protein